MAYPDNFDEMREIAQAHKEQEPEPLLLAIYYADSTHDSYDNLLEIYEGYDRNRVSPEQWILTTSFGPASGFPLASGSLVRLLITNPKELEAAVNDDWSDLRSFLTAVVKGQYKVVYSEGAYGERLLSLLTNERQAA